MLNNRSAFADPLPLPFRCSRDQSTNNKPRRPPPRPSQEAAAHRSKADCSPSALLKQGTWSCPRGSSWRAMSRAGLRAWADRGWGEHRGRGRAYRGVNARKSASHVGGMGGSFGGRKARPSGELTCRLLYLATQSPPLRNPHVRPQRSSHRPARYALLLGSCRPAPAPKLTEFPSQAAPSPTPPISSTPLSTSPVPPKSASPPTFATRPSSPTPRAEVISARTASRAETSSWEAPCCSPCSIRGGRAIRGTRELIGECVGES